MNDENLSNLIQKIGHHIGDIRDRSVIMLMQKYQKNLIDETDFKKRNFFFYIILHYINDRNSLIPLKNLIDVLSFVLNITKKDDEIKVKFEELDIYKFLKEFLAHFKNNEEKYKSSSSSKTLNVIKGDDLCPQNYEKSIAENNINEFNEVIKILNELIRLYSCDKNDDILKYNSNGHISKINVENNTLAYENDAGANYKNLSNKKKNLSNEKVVLSKINEKNNNKYKKKTNNSNKNLICENNLNIKDEENKNASSTKESMLEEAQNFQSTNYLFPEKEKENLSNSRTTSSCTSTYNKICEKDLLNINQIMKKNNYINIFTKNNYLKSDDFAYYNSLYFVKNKVNEKSIYLLLNYKRHKANKIKEEYDCLNYKPSSIPSLLIDEADSRGSNYLQLLNNYTFFYLYNFFDCFDVFKKNFNDINDIRGTGELCEKSKLKVGEQQPNKSEHKSSKKYDEKNEEKANTLDCYSEYLNRNYIYNKNISYKIANYINKTKLLHFYMQMKFNYFELLGINIIKKKISVDDLIYMNKEVNKILNEYIYIFNKDILLFNYKFLYTLSYNIHYIYTTYMENKQIENDFNHINNILNNLSYIIFIMIYSLYINLNKRGACLCNSICNIYINNYFFQLNQNLFYLLFLCKNKNNNESNAITAVINHPMHVQDKHEFPSKRKQNNIQLINNINSFYYNKNVKKLLNATGKNAILELNQNDMYHYLFITKNNCIYFFKVLILFMLEILKISYLKINRINQNCSTLNFHIENFTVIYDFLHNIIIHYFNETEKIIDDHLKIMIDFIEESNFNVCLNKKTKKDDKAGSSYIASNIAIDDVNNISSSSSFLSIDLKKNQFESIDIFLSDSHRYTYKYNSKQIEILKITCLYINYTPVSFILMKKIKIKLVNMFKFFLFDIHLNTHYIEILYFFKIFFFFYDHQIYKEYNDFLLYYYSLSNLFFIYNTNSDYEDENQHNLRSNELSNNKLSSNNPSNNKLISNTPSNNKLSSNIPSNNKLSSNNQLDIFTFINTSNNIFHFFFFLSTSYSTLNTFLEKYYSSCMMCANSCSYDSDGSFSNNNSSSAFAESLKEAEAHETLKCYNSLNRLQSINVEHRNKSFKEDSIKKFWPVLLQKIGNDNKQWSTFQMDESFKHNEKQKKNVNFCFNFIQSITNVIIENNLNMLFNSFLLISSEYNNFSSYITPYKQDNSMYQFIVDKLKHCNNKMNILTFDYPSENKKNVVKNSEFIELFKNFLLLLHNIISVIYSYNNEIIYFFFNFVFNINHERTIFLKEEDNKLCNSYPKSFNHMTTYNNEVNLCKEKKSPTHLYDKITENTIGSMNTKRKENTEKTINYSSTCYAYTTMNNNGINEKLVENNGRKEYSHGNNYKCKMGDHDGEVPLELLTPYVETTQDALLFNEKSFIKRREEHFRKNAFTNIETEHTNKYHQNCKEEEVQFDNHDEMKWTNCNPTIKYNEYSANNDLNSSNNKIHPRKRINSNNSILMFNESYRNINETKNYPSDKFISPFQLSEFVDVIYEICIYSKKELRDYYTFFILENIKKKISTMFELLKHKDINEKKVLLSNIKIFTKVLLLLHFIKKKYIIIFEQTVYSSFSFLYENYFSPFFNQTNEKNEYTTEQVINNIYFYQNVFLNVHNLYFFLFQRKKKSRTFSLKIMWKMYHQFKIKFSKIKLKDESNKSVTLRSTGNTEIDNCKKGHDLLRDKGHISSKLPEQTYKSDINRKVQDTTDSHSKTYNTFKYSSDLNFNTNIINLYISDFLLNQVVNDETVLLTSLTNIDINKEEFPSQLFNRIISVILRRNVQYSKYRTSQGEEKREEAEGKEVEGEGEDEDEEEEKEKEKEVKEVKEGRKEEEMKNSIIFSIYEKIFHLYLKLIKEILIKEQTKLSNIDSFAYVLKIIILLLITNYRNSKICKRIYKEKYFFLSHLYCFFFYENEIVKALAISLSFYLIFDQNILLLNKYRIFLEPYLLLEHKISRKKRKKKENTEEDTSFLLNRNMDSEQNPSSISLEYSIIDEIKIEHMKKYYIDNKEENTTNNFSNDNYMKTHWALKKYSTNFFNLHRNKNKYIEHDTENSFDNLNKISFHIEHKIIYFIPFWLYKTLQPNNFLLNIKKLRSFFFFSTKYSYLHTFHDSNVNNKEKQMCFFGNYNNSNIFRSFFLFINKYYYLTKNLNYTSLNNGSISYHINLPIILKGRNKCKENLDTPFFTTTNIYSFLFLNIKVDRKSISQTDYSPYITNLLLQLKQLPPINDCLDDEMNFTYIYNLNNLFSFLNNCYMQFLYTENSSQSNKEEDQNADHSNYISTEKKHSQKRDKNYDRRKEKKRIHNNVIFNREDHQAKQIYCLFENDYNEIVYIINFVYNTIFSYVHKLLFFTYNQLMLSSKQENSANNEHTKIHKNLILLEHFLNVIDICLYIDLILQKNECVKYKISELNKDIDLSLFIYKLLYISVATSTLKNKISSFCLNLIYNFIKLDNYYLKMKYSCYNNYDQDMQFSKGVYYNKDMNFSNGANYDQDVNFYKSVNYDQDINFNLNESEESINPIMLKEEEQKNRKLKDKNKNLSTLINFLFFIISKYTKRIIKKKKNQINKNSGIYSNIVNVYEFEKTINIENVTFQNHEKEYLKLDIYFLKNVMCMLHVIMKKGCFMNLYTINNHISNINFNILTHYDYKLFTDNIKKEADERRKIQEKDEHTSAEKNVKKEKKKMNRTSSRSSDNSNSRVINIELENTQIMGISDNNNVKTLYMFKHIFLNRYMKILTSFCNIYNDIIVECLYIQLLLFLFKYILQVLKFEISKENSKENIRNLYHSKQPILVYFFKYYKADKEICKFLKRIYFIILKYTIYMQNIQMSKEDTSTVHINNIQGNIEKNDCTDKEIKNDINKHNYILKEEDIYKNYCKLFYEYTINKFKRCKADTCAEEDESANPHECDRSSVSSHSYNFSNNNSVLNSNYVYMIDLYCPNCEETKILFLSIILFLSFTLDNFPFFFSLNNCDNRVSKKEKSCERKEKDNIIILCERIFYFLSKKNIYINFSILKEAKLLEKYFIKIFIKLLFCNESEGMNNLQKYEIYAYKHQTDSTYIENSECKNAGVRKEHGTYCNNFDNSQSNHSKSFNSNMYNSTIDGQEKCIIIKKECNNDYMMTEEEKKVLSMRRRYNKDDDNFAITYSTNKNSIFMKNMTQDNHFYLNNFLNCFLIEKRRKKNLECIYDKIYYYILIVSMCFKDKNFLSLILTKNEKFYNEFNEMIQEYLKYVLKNKQQVNRKKKKNEMMIHNLLYIFVSHIYIYLNDLYNIFFTQIKNVLAFPSFFQNIIYISNTSKDTFYEENTLYIDDTSIGVYYDTLINMKKQNWNKNLEYYVDQDIKSTVVHNIFHNNNIYLLILYIINNNKYNLKKENKKKNSSFPHTVNDYEEAIKTNYSIENFHLDHKNNNKLFLNKITTNILLFFLLFFYDYYSSNYEIKENILMQIVRHILEHFTILFTSDFLNIQMIYSEFMKNNNLKKKKLSVVRSKNGLNRFLRKLPGDNPLQYVVPQNDKNELTENINTKKSKFTPIKNSKYSRAEEALSKIREEGKRKREAAIKGKKWTDKTSIGKACIKIVEKKDTEKKGTEMKGKANSEAEEGEEQSLNPNSISAACNIEPNGINKESTDITEMNLYVITNLIEKIKRYKKLLFLYTINCFRIIQTCNNISSLIFKYKYISVLLQKFSYFTNKNIVECIYSAFNFYINNYFKGKINFFDEKSLTNFGKEIGYFSYIYIDYFFNFICCFILYDVLTFYKFCSNTLNCLDILNTYFKELINNKKGSYICITILNFYLSILNSYFFDFSLYQNTLHLIEEGEITKDGGSLKQYVISNLKCNNKKEQKEGITYFECVKKLSEQFNKSKFLSFLINYIIDNLDNNVNKGKLEIERKNHVIILILQLLSYQVIFIDNNKNEILKLATTLIKYLKKKDTCLLLIYYIIIFFNSCFLNSFFDERLISLLFNFDKNDNIWFNLIFMSSNKTKKNKEVLILIKFSILHLYLLLLKNKNSFKRCILCISSDINIYFVFIYVLNEIYEHFKSFNNEESIKSNITLNKLEKNKNENENENRHTKKYFYLYAELLVIVTDIIKILNTNDVNKYITLHHNKEKDNLSVQFKNLYKKIKNELKHLEQLIKLIKYTIFLHPLMINIHILHKFYLCIYIKEFYFFHKTFFKYDVFLVNYVRLIKNKKKAKLLNIDTSQQKEASGSFSTDAITETISTEKNADMFLNKNKKKDNPNFLHSEFERKKKKITLQKWDDLHKEKLCFYFFFNTPKNYNYQVNNLCSSILQNEFHFSLRKFFSSSFQEQNRNYTNYSQYNSEQIKIYTDYIFDSINYAINFFNAS
ncbi:hypothetical protein MKS88_004697 [Plasmodium brasilianum]|uniref:Uncharacterized protein n=1 Tax=Plasmodium brasilianum TaxID=5824 RepID=A0ACB9Y6U3_PLABR|nr:hypothetical protein MKS88_004697 [Plasmodium brasilianum]